MSKKRKSVMYMADFETTVYDGQTETEVWAAALVKIGTEAVVIYHSIGDFLHAVETLSVCDKTDIIIYFHNLKFDGTFILSYLLSTGLYRQALQQDRHGDYRFSEDKQLSDGYFKYMVSDMGQWYEITLKYQGHFIRFRDSLKLLPFSVKKIGKDFKTKHQKLEMEYKGYRYAGCEITPAEQEYIANDVLVVAEALQMMMERGHDKTTIGGCCLAEFKKQYPKRSWDAFFPDQSDEYIDECFGSKTADEYVRKSYRGGWCYVVDGKQNKIFDNGVTADVNSLYPSMMHSQSGNYYPVGCPRFLRGKCIPFKYQDISKYYYFARVRTRFYIKKDKLPFIMINGNWRYPARTALTTSDVKNADGEYCKYITTLDGEVEPTSVELTLTCTDLQLMREHYDLVDFEILDFAVYQSKQGLFDDYIDKYAKIKKASKGAERALAKLFLNNLYGKTAQSSASNFKIARLDNGILKFSTQLANDRKVIYIPIGSAITSYARNFTIRAAQQNYYGSDKAGFIYADTDSIHCDLPADKIRGIKIHEADFCCWKLENEWDRGIFVRAKTYIEHTVKCDGVPVAPFYQIKCAGMSPESKSLFNAQLASGKAKMTEFKVGFEIAGKKLPKQIKGGTVLFDTNFKLHPKR